MNKPLKGFITYSHEDIQAKDELRKRLAVMEQQNELVTWDDGQLTPGDGTLQEDILRKVADSDLLLYLVSAASLDSKNCNRELAEAIEGDKRVIPIILEHCDWLVHQLSGFEVLPHKGKPLNEWVPESKGWQNVVEGIQKVVEEGQAQAKSSSEKTQNKQLAEWIFQQGNFLMILEHFDEAIEAYSHAIDLNLHHAFVYYNRGVAYSNKAELDHAIGDYDTAIKLKPDHAKAYNNSGLAYYDKGKVDLAIKDYNKAIELDPNYTYPYINRGIAYRKGGDVNLAIKDYNKAIELDPNDADTYNNRGNAYTDKGELDNAINDYTEAIKLNPDHAKAHNNRGNAYYHKGEVRLAIKDYNKAIKLKPDFASPYNNRGNVYKNEGEVRLAIKDYNKAIKLKPNYDIAYNNRAEAWLRLREWEKARADLIDAKRMGLDIVALFHNAYKGVEKFEKQFGFKLPEDIAHLLTERLRTRYPKTRSVLDADGNPLQSPNVLNLLSQLRSAGIPLGESVKTKPAFGINTTPTDVFVVDKATRDELIASHAGSAEILKPFLHGQDLRRWHVDTPHQWLIFAHRGIAINDYPAILKHLEKYQETLSRRRGKQKWYELPASLDDAERFAQPKLVCPDTYNHQTFAVDTAGYYYGKTAYLIPTEETWLCGLLNSRTVEWFYSQVSNQLTIDWLRARSGYIQQIPIPDIAPVHKALIAKIVDYLIYLQQQPEINSKDLKYARDRIMLGYFERVIDGLVYEAYLPAELHKSDKVFLQPLLDEGLPLIEEIQGDKMSVFRNIFELLYEKTHPIRRNLFFLDSVKLVRIIEGKL